MAGKNTDVEAMLRGQADAPSNVVEFPEFVEATFQGFFYAGGIGGLEKASFTETVKVPMRLIKHPMKTPIGIFRDIIGPRVLRDKPGFSGVAYVQLIDSKGIPEGLSVEKQLDWSGSHPDLTKLAKVHAPGVKAGMYPKPNELRHAIKECMKDPIAFSSHQNKDSSARVEEHMIAEDLAALGY